MSNRNFIIECRDVYFKKITPASELTRRSLEYLELIDVAREIVAKKGLEFFSFYFQEGQYFVDLWTAHIILEYMEPDKTLKEQSINIIRNYSTSTFSPEVAIEEQEWLLRNRY